ncbi:MAG: hypothetical protein NVV74_13170 [Magnetospirillum sp.]|nr:hypothetical protein [Magnetospirillum sp.]
MTPSAIIITLSATLYHLSPTASRNSTSETMCSLTWKSPASSLARCSVNRRKVSSVSRAGALPASANAISIRRRTSSSRSVEPRTTRRAALASGAARRDNSPERERLPAMAVALPDLGAVLVGQLDVILG